MGAIFSSPSDHFSPSDIIETRSGKIQGKRFTLEDARQVDAFLGIQYGKPPVDELRFKKPVPVEPWDGIRDCTKFGPSCPYDTMILEYLVVSNPVPAGKDEDCLYLNVFAPTWKPKEDQPNGFAVMVWIHGGGFTVHSGNNYGDINICKTLCTKDVIVVTINYRLGFFGFLTTGDEHSVGNYGLWDQTLALKWIKDNISSFGGDPNNITVFGQSAGGMSTDLLSLSPHSRDLFQKMIPMAGASGCSFIMHSAEHVRGHCLKYAQEHGFKMPETDDICTVNKSLVDFFKTLIPSQLSIGMHGKPGYSLEHGKLTPILDGDFFPKSYEELRKEAPKKPRMTGVTKNEGVFFMMVFHYHYQFDIVQKIEHYVTEELEKRKVKNLEEAKKKVMAMYLKDVDLKDKKALIRKYVDVLSDTFITLGTWQCAVEAAQKDNTVYQYMFEYVNPASFGLGRLLAPFISSTHCSEIPYVFGKSVISNFHPDENDLKMIDKFTTYFTNFAKYGNPNDKDGKNDAWKPLTLERPTEYFKINLKESKMEDNLHKGRMEIWQKILNE